MIPEALGPYRIVETIAAGGTAVILRARDEAHRRDVAIKVLLQGQLADGPAREDLRREGVTLSRLNHPNIAVYHDAGSQDGIEYLVMEYIEGQTLEETLQSRGALAESEVVGLALQIAAALENAHSQGVIHRDLKPRNIVLTSEGGAKVLDFGQALAPSGESPGADHAGQAVAGTLPYMAPEQLLHEPADPRTDIYALGVVLYEASTGHRLFTSETSDGLVEAILLQEPRPPRSINPDLSARFDRMVLRALVKKPAGRYQTAGALIAQLPGLANMR